MGSAKFLQTFGAAREPINVFFFPLSSLVRHSHGENYIQGAAGGSQPRI